MNTPGINSNQPVNPESLMALMDKTDSETKKATKNKRSLHHQKARSLIENRINKLRERKSNLWKAALFGFFVDIFSQGIKALNFLVPGLGDTVSRVFQTLKSLNPFQHKAATAEIDAAEFEGLANSEREKFNKVNEQVREIEDQRKVRNKRLEKALNNMQEAQEATVRV